MELDIPGGSLAYAPAASPARPSEALRTSAETSEQPYSVVVDEITDEQWWQVLAGFSDASIYQTIEYGDVRWGRKNLSRLIVRDRDGGVVAAAQARVVKVPLLRAGIAYVAWGPMWQPRGRARCIDRLRFCVRALIDEYVVSRGLFLRLRPFGFEETDADVEQVLREEGCRPTEGLQRDRHRTILVDLEPSAEELRQRLRKSWRRTLRLSEEAGLEILERYDAELFQPFTPIYRDMVETKKFQPGSSLDDFRRLQERLPAEQRMRMTICREGGQPVAGSACSAIGDTVVGLLSASADAGRRTSAYYLLQWDEILWSKRAGKRFYDLGGINPVTNPGVYNFKSGLRGKEVTFLGVYDICRSRILYRVTLGLEKAVRARQAIRRSR